MTHQTTDTISYGKSLLFILVAFLCVYAGCSFATWMHIPGYEKALETAIGFTFAIPFFLALFLISGQIKLTKQGFYIPDGDEFPKFN